MKIISWNVNWIRAVNKKGFKEFVEKENPDILAIQETKAFEEQFLKEVSNLEWYKYIWHNWERAGYAGTAIFYKENLKIKDTKSHFWEIEHFHTDGRITEIEFFLPNEEKTIVLINWYFPNWWQKVNWPNMLDYKLEFYNHLINYTKKLEKEWKNIIIAWDFNICHTEIDIARPEANKNSIWFLPVEREKIWELFESGFVDVWRYLNPTKTDVYSWWSYRAGARPRNVGWRIDYFAVSKNILKRVEDMKYLTDVMGSDHCPLVLKV